MKMKFALTCVLSVACSMSHAQAPDNENAHMVVDTADQACLQLQDTNQWTAFTNNLQGVGTVVTLDTYLNTALNAFAPQLTSSNHPPTIGYINGVQWGSSDQGSQHWIPQGMVLGTSSGGIGYAVNTWYWQPLSGDTAAQWDRGSRITLMNAMDLSNAHYAGLLLTASSGHQTYGIVNIHAGGATVFGTYLYVADSNNGFRVFDLNNIRQMDGTSAECIRTDGTPNWGQQPSGHWCAGGYQYILPQIGAYKVPATKEDGTTISSYCKPAFSWAQKDTRPATQQLLSGEFCGIAKDLKAVPPIDEQCKDINGNDDPTGLNGRLYQWPMGSDNKIITDAAGYVSPTKVYWMNQRNVQGVAQNLIKNADGTYQTDVYWLASTNDYGRLIKVSPTATAKYWRYVDSMVPKGIEGLHSTSNGHLWISNEGDPTKSTVDGGRVLLYIDANQVN